MELKIENLSKVYGTKKALSCVSLKLEPGIYGILGPNGAGKSTFLELLTDNITRTSGEIYYNEEPILKMGAAYRDKLGYMPQQQDFCNHMKARDFLYYIGQLKGIKRRKLKQESERLLTLVHLEAVSEKCIGSFSGGMKQRILLAQALLGDPEILLLDEPTAGLDPKERIYIRNMISELSDNKIILFVTHVVSDIESIADKIILINGGKIIVEGAPLKLIASLTGKIGIRRCKESDLPGIEEQYKVIYVIKKDEDIEVRFIDEKVPDIWQLNTDQITLEDVYMYYLEESI